jgi:ParB/RepB/Spo0J family partition protein
VTTAAPSGLTRLIPIDLIDEPEIAMREAMSDEGLESLMASLRELGQLQPIGVVVAGDRFRVAYGHRRRIAAGRVGFSALECKVWPEGTPLEEAMKVAENDEQEAVNPASEATYYKWLFANRCGNDVERVAALVRKPVSRVLDRLDLLRGDPRVLEQLRAKRITLSVAKALNKCPDEGYRRLFLDDAVRMGSNARQVQTWIDDVKRTLRLQESGQEAGMTTELMTSFASSSSMDACTICGRDSDQHEMEYRKVHASCFRWYRRQMDAPGAMEPPR